MTGAPWSCDGGAHLAHLQLKEAALLLHVLCDLAAAELSADHPVLPGVFPLLLLDLCPARVRGQRSGVRQTASDHQELIMCLWISQFGLVILPGFLKWLLQILKAEVTWLSVTNQL